MTKYNKQKIGQQVVFVCLTLIIWIQAIAETTKPHKISIVLFASDTPNEFIYYSTFFTKNLNKEKKFHALHDHEMNSIWLKNAHNQTTLKNAESQIVEMTKILRSSYKNNYYKKLISTHNEFEKKFYDLMTIYPTDINPHLLSEFFFWSAIAETIGHKKMKNSLLLYKKYATITERNLFATEIDLKTLKEIQSFNIKLQKNIPIYSKSECHIYVNGYKLKKTSVTLPLNLKSVLSASCSEGNFSQIFIPEKTHSILIQKFVNPLQIKSMPNVKYLPKNKINSENIDYLILVFWSKKLNLLEAKLIDGRNFTILKEISYQLQNQNELNSTLNKLTTFLSSQNMSQ